MQQQPCQVKRTPVETRVQSPSAEALIERLVGLLRRLTGQALVHAPTVTYAGLFTYDTNGVFSLERSGAKTTLGLIGMPDGVARRIAEQLLPDAPVRPQKPADVMLALCKMVQNDTFTEARFLGVMAKATPDVCQILQTVYAITTSEGNVCFELFELNRTVRSLDDIAVGSASAPRRG
jgi:hypothetical protein